MEHILRKMARDSKESGELDVSECFTDGTFVAAKRGCWGGKDQAGQRFEAHANARRRWSSNRYMRYKLLAHMK